MSCYQSRMTNGLLHSAERPEQQERKGVREREREREEGENEKKESAGRSQRRSNDDDCHSHYEPVDVIIYDVVNFGAKIQLAYTRINLATRHAERRGRKLPSLSYVNRTPSS